jgi:hypothetical protein
LPFAFISPLGLIVTRAAKGVKRGVSIPAARVGEAASAHVIHQGGAPGAGAR